MRRLIIRGCESQQPGSVTVHVSTPKPKAGLEEGAQKQRTMYNILDASMGGVVDRFE